MPHAAHPGSDPGPTPRGDEGRDERRASAAFASPEGRVEVLEEILDATIALQEADFGSIQLYDARSETLEVIAQRGFPDDFLHRVRETPVHRGGWGRALMTGNRVIVEDVEADPGLLPDRELIASAGFRAIQATPIIGRGGSPLGLLSTHFREPHRPSERALWLTDLYVRQAAEILERRASEEELRRTGAAAEEASRAKSRFLAVLSHEMRTPLNAILGYAQLLEEGIPETVGEQALGHVRRIDASAAHLMQIIEEVLTFSRLEAGREELELDRLDVERMVADLRNMIEPLSNERGVGFRIHGEGLSASCVTDPRKLRQILVNLLGNAVKFTDRGEISLEIQVERRWLLFHVRDTGIGIPGNQLGLIFEPFMQGEPSARTRSGSGLGLSISRSLARRLGGDIEVESIPGRGSTFSLRIPLRSPAEARH